MSAGIFTIEVTNTIIESVTYDAEDSENNGLIYPTSVLLADDLEGGAPGWSSGFMLGTVDDLWHTSNTLPLANATSWWCGQEGTGDYNTGRRIGALLNSPFVDMVVPRPIITLLEQYDTEPAEDMVRVEAITVGGTVTSIRPDQSGSTGGTVFTTLDLSAVQGQNVYIRFILESSDGTGNNYLGWKIDDVLIRNDQAKTADFMSP